MDSEPSKKKEKFSLVLGKNIPTLVNYYVGLH
jgi:hypothetical protein